MSCPTCDHTMQCVAGQASETRLFWCPRCGTLKREHGMESVVDAPKIVNAARWARHRMSVGTTEYATLEECCLLPGERNKRNGGVP